jgi:hypothetical protein
VLSASPLAQYCVDLVDEDDARLQLAGQTEDGVDELVAVTIPLLCEGRNVQVDEAGARLVGQGLGQHSLSAAGGAVQQHAARGAQQRRRMRVEVRHGQRVDDRLLQLLDDGVQTANVFERHGDLLGRNHLHSDALLVAVQHQVLHARPPVVRVLFIVAVVLAVAFPPLAAQDGIEFAGRGGGFGACFFLLLGVGVEPGEEVANDKVGYQGLQGLSVGEQRRKEGASGLLLLP